MNNKFHRSSTTMTNIDGEKVRRLRETKGLTQLYVATVVGVTTDTISRWENRRYPSIKQENAVKLAEALEVRLSDILEDQDHSPLEKKEVGPDQRHEAQDERRPGRKSTILRFLLSVLILIAIVSTIAWWFYTKQQAFSISAYRVLPPHAPPGKIFPIIIHVEVTGIESFSLILKEYLPEGFVPVKSFPPFTNIDAKNGTLKWIKRRGGEKATFAYIVKIPLRGREGERYRFKGTVTLRNTGGSTVTILGSDVITCSNFHWADTNKDGKINDEEILAAYDKFSALDELGFDWDQIDDIWSNQGYFWDATNREYIVIP